METISTAKGRASGKDGLVYLNLRGAELSFDSPCAASDANAGIIREHKRRPLPFSG
ncbi:MAG: hypothetical protein K6C36_01725 [Clostridia bacterium]|nr:hypothetical protein [Clostridia bacterium]